MTVAPGTCLGPYEIVAPIGVGGMGEVFRARDTRLERNVAIKILPAALAHDPQFRARFEREAKTISQLNHPHICQIYDVGEAVADESSAVSYLVMELLEGDSLADRLTRGALPLPDVLRYGAQIADALAAAHRAGIVHRDLKPGNIMITRGGAKLLDFGLAKGASAVAPIQFDATGATEHKPLTAQGTILGTFQYMAPEQLEGEDADARTDIFALGCLLYEMLTGRRAFEGKTKTSLIAAIVSGTPRPVSELQPITPPALEHVITRCLAKERDGRWQSAQDVATELRWIGSAGEAGAAAGTTSRGAVKAMLGRPRLALAGWIVALAAGAAAIFFATSGNKPPGQLRSELAAEPQMPVANAVDGAVTLAPDGGRLTYVTVSGNVRHLVVRDLSSGHSTLLRGTEGASFPFWSPEGSMLGFFAHGKLKTVAASGGPVQIVCDARDARGGAWGRNGVLIFTPGTQEPLYRVDEGGGTPARITDNKGGLTHRNPYFLPDGETFLYVSRSRSLGASGDIYAGSIADPKVKKRVIENGSNVQFSNGYLLFIRNRNLVAQRFDSRKLVLKGPPLPVAENVEYFEQRDIGNFAASANGLLVYRRQVNTLKQLTWFSRDGIRAGDLGEPGPFRFGALSPDGRRVRLEVGDGITNDIWLMNAAQGTMTRATDVKAYGVSAAFSPDGARLAVAVSASSGVPSRLWTQPVAGLGSRRELLKTAAPIFITDWSPDGRFLVGIIYQNATGVDIVSIPAGGGPLRLLINGPHTEREPRVSPDGKWLAYNSSETGQFEVFVTTFPTPSDRMQISSTGGGGAEWSADGRELFFVSEDKLMSVAVTGSFEDVQPKALPVAMKDVWYDVSPDGRFLVAIPSGDAEPNPLRLVVNWSKDLRRE